MKSNRSFKSRNKLSFDAQSTDEEIGDFIDNIRIAHHSRNYLTDILSERHTLYSERPSYQVVRIRGYAFASYSIVGLPDTAISLILDELQNGTHAYTVAGAAVGLRGAKQPRAEYSIFLLQALNNIRYHDDSLDLNVFKPSWPLQNPSNAKKEILATFQWLEGYAKGALPELKSFLTNFYDFSPEILKEIEKTIEVIEADTRELNLSCCQVSGKNIDSTCLRNGNNIKAIGNLKVQNEERKTKTLESFINQKPAVVAFFYTRCMNPNKCTLTINKMGWLQKELKKIGLQDQVSLLSFTYDSAYDTPAKMRVFGENRGLVFDSNTHMLRTTPEDFSILSDFFQLGVNHAASTVNQHRLELYVLDKRGHIDTTYTQLQWEIDDIIDDLARLVNQSSIHNWISTTSNFSQQIVFPILLAFFPKCPVCWAAYLSVFGISSIQSIPYSPWLIPVIMVIMVFNLFLLHRKSKTRNGLAPFWVSFIGTILVGTGYLLSNQIPSYIGICLIFIGALLNSLSVKNWSKVNYFFGSIFNKLINLSPLKSLEIRN